MDDQDDPRARLFEVLRELDTAMLVTQRDGRPHARPMAVAAVENDELVFVTSEGSPKTDEIRSDDLVQVVMQSKLRFAAVWGHARIVEDRARVARLWKADWKVWFPDGKDDPAIRLIVVEPMGGEYWDNAGTKGVRYLLESAKALAKGTRPRPVGREQHGKVG